MALAKRAGYAWLIFRNQPRWRWKQVQSAIAEAQELRRVERGTRARTRDALRRMQTERGLRLDIGTSGQHVPGWISLDIDPDEHGIRLDAGEPWPLPDASAEAVRSEHLVEHLPFERVRVYFSEAFRVLEPGGVIRTCTPDLEAIAREYLRRDEDVLAAHQEHGYEAPTWAHFVNNYLRLWGHCFIFDLDSIRTLLTEAGFEHVERVAFGESRHEVLAGTDSHDMGALRDLVLCVDAVKPRSGSDLRRGYVGRR